MDMIGPMPKRAWVEVRAEDGELLEQVRAEIQGGAISAQVPGFDAGARGSIELITDGEPMIEGAPAIGDLPAEPR